MSQEKTITITGLIQNIRVMDGKIFHGEKERFAFTGFLEFPDVWRSKFHSDGTMYDGWFILGIGKEKGEQITYHLPNDRWDEVSFAETLDRAPKWDGHTVADVLERLKTL